MKGNDHSLEVAVIQASTPLFDSAAAVEKACRLIAEAGASGARLIVLPEAFVGGYPRGLGFGTVVGNRSREGRELFARYHEGALEVPGRGVARLGAAAARARAFVGVGVVEREAGHPGTLYARSSTSAPMERSSDATGSSSRPRPSAWSGERGTPRG
jgi:nitrilase